MKNVKFYTRNLVLAFVLVSIASPIFAAVSPENARFDAAKIEPFRQKNEKFKTLEKEGQTPAPWQFGSWANGAMSEATLVADAGDGKPALKIVNISGQPSAMLKPYTEVTLKRGTWEARTEYRKAGKAGGNFVIDGPGKQSVKVALPPTGAAFQTAVLPIEITATANVRLTFQLYSGLGEEESLYLRSFNLESVGDVSDATKASEAQAEVARNTEVEAVAVRETARRAAERKPIGGWVRPEAKPVPMTKPLAPPPVTGKTFYAAPTGDDKGDGSKGSPWRSVQFGLNQLQPGDCLYLRGGEYRESMLTFARSGKPDAYITVAGFPGETAKIVNSGGLAVFNLDAGSRFAGINLNERAYIVIHDLSMDVVNGNQAVRINGPMQLDEYKGNLPKSRGLRHNIWVAGCDITGGNGSESVLGAGYGAHDVVISNNRIHDMPGGLNSYLFSDGTIIEWNTVFNTSTEQDDAGAIKSMAPNVIIRYNTVYGNNRNPLSKKPGWAPASEGGKQWRFLQGISGIYCDYAMVSENNPYPKPLIPADPTNYVYGNTVYNNNAGIFAYKSDNTQIFDNVVYGNGRAGTHGFVEGDPTQKRLDFVGPAGYGIRVAASENVRVFRNVSYDNEKAGLALSAGGTQVWNNAFWGNDLAQIQIQTNNEVALGFNAILAADRQGPPFRQNKTDFATPDAFRQKYPYLDEATQVVPMVAGKTPLETAQQWLQTGRVSDALWSQAQQSLTAKARAAGVGAPVKAVP